MRILWIQRESEYVRDLIASPAATIELVKMGETSLSENQSNALLSFSMPVADEHTNKTAISEVYDLTLPEPESLAANPKGMSVFWMSRHQWMFEQPYLVDPDWVLNTPLRQVWLRYRTNGCLGSFRFSRAQIKSYFVSISECIAESLRAGGCDSERNPPSWCLSSLLRQI